LVKKPKPLKWILRDLTIDLNKKENNLLKNVNFK